MQETYGHHTMQGRVLLWEAPALRAILTLWLLDQSDVMWQFEKLIWKDLCLLNLGANLLEEVQNAHA